MAQSLPGAILPLKPMDWASSLANVPYWRLAALKLAQPMALAIAGALARQSFCAKWKRRSFVREPCMAGDAENILRYSSLVKGALTDTAQSPCCLQAPVRQSCAD